MVPRHTKTFDLGGSSKWRKKGQFGSRLSMVGGTDQHWLLEPNYHPALMYLMCARHTELGYVANFRILSRYVRSVRRTNRQNSEGRVF